MAATGQLAVDASRVNPLGGRMTVSPWLIHTVIRLPRSGTMPSRSSPVPSSVSSAPPYSRRSAGTTWPPRRYAMACMP